MNHTANAIFTEIIGVYLELREDDRLCEKEKLALQEILHWNSERAIQYFKELYPEHANKLMNLNTFRDLTDETRILIIKTEMDTIMDEMLIS
jgi:hypothetical protein